MSSQTNVFKKITKNNFALKKLKKPPSKVAQNNSNPLFSLLPELPKRPKRKNSCSKMWPIDQLYIELGENPRTGIFMHLGNKNVCRLKPLPCDFLDVSL
jgi:hypothetical protein